jgi:hypothetical protein
MDQAEHRTQPADVRHGGVLIVAGRQVGEGQLADLCALFAGDGYETVACRAGADADLLLAGLEGPRFAIGLGEGADAALGLPAHAVSAFPSQALPPHAGPPRAIVHVTRALAGLFETWEAGAPETPVFVYDADEGFFEGGEGDPARLARLRTLALFRRTVSRGES